MKAAGTSLTAWLVSIVLSLGAAAIAEAQAPIRIGASVSQTGAYALLGQNQLRGLGPAEGRHTDGPPA